jgi:methyl-accepting chemotaxis protein
MEEMIPSRLFTKVLGVLVFLYGVTLAAVAVFSAWVLTAGLTEEYQTKGVAIARSIAGASVETLLYRDEATVQALIDQYLDTPGVSYVFVADARGEIISHTFAPSIPQAVRTLTPSRGGGQARQLSVEGVGEVIDVAAPILEGEIGVVHVGMDRGVIASSVRSVVLKEVVLLSLIFFGGCQVAFVVVRKATSPLRKMAAMLEEIAKGEGDLTRRIEIRTRDEVGETARWFNVFIGKIHDLVVQLKAAVAQTGGAADQLSATASQLSAGTQEQASSLEAAAARLGEITLAVRQNAERVRQANQLARLSRVTAEQGGRVVGEAVGAMNAIIRSSRKVAEITSAIDEIAFRTNLLALNAAVEAARAGAQGRGFAVVAAEVRALAQGAAAAAREIKDLIRDAVTTVEKGSELVGKSGKALGEIVLSANGVSDVLAEITAAATEQSTGIDEVNRAASQIDAVVRQSAAQAQQVSSTADGLSRQAEDLRAVTGQFRVCQDEVRSSPAAPTTWRRGRVEQPKAAPLSGRSECVDAASC